MLNGLFSRPFRIRRQDPWVIYGTMALCILVYVIDTLSGWINTLTYGFDAYGWLSVYGMKDNDFILAGQWWRFLTANFLHGGLQHIFFNMFSLYMWGRFVEGIYGHGRTVWVVLASALMTTAVSFAFSPHNSLGASGIAFGLMGALLAFGCYNRAAFERFFGGSMMVMVAINLFYGFFASSVDGFGHLGGLAGGFAAGLLAGALIRRCSKAQVVLIAAGYLAVAAAAVAVGFMRW